MADKTFMREHLLTKEDKLYSEIIEELVPILKSKCPNLKFKIVRKNTLDIVGSTADFDVLYRCSLGWGCEVSVTKRFWSMNRSTRIASTSGHVTADMAYNHKSYVVAEMVDAFCTVDMSHVKKTPLLSPIPFNSDFGCRDSIIRNVMTVDVIGINHKGKMVENISAPDILPWFYIRCFVHNITMASHIICLAVRREDNGLVFHPMRRGYIVHPQDDLAHFDFAKICNSVDERIIDNAISRFINGK